MDMEKKNNLKNFVKKVLEGFNGEIIKKRWYWNEK